MLPCRDKAVIILGHPAVLIYMTMEYKNAECNVKFAN